eukprot:5031141-Pyramimonas_sp.AAC.1
MLPTWVDTQAWYCCMGGRDATITGEIFTDGSAKCPLHWPEANRAGWGIAAMNGHRALGMARGPLRGPQLAAQRGELCAIIQALKHGQTPMKIKTDCLGIVEGLEQGERRAAHPRRENVDLLRK